MEQYITIFIKVYKSIQYPRSNKFNNQLCLLIMLVEASHHHQLNLHEFISQKHEQKIPALPLEFEYFPVQVLSKQFTKLNSNHPYRVHYLGPRPLTTLMLHKRYSSSEGQQQKKQTCSPLKDIIHFKHYKVNLKKIINCNFTNERMQQNNHYKSAIFYRAFQGMNPTLPLQKQFVFNSAFESGNLDCVIKVKSNQFDLFLRIDSNTRGHTSWYYFSIKNGNRLETVTFNICNLTKPNQLYQQGMRPFVFSKKAYVQKLKGWEQNTVGDFKIQQAILRYDFIYEQVSIPTTYRISFDYTFQYEDDEVFFAYCIPYTYSQLQHDIKIYQQSPYVRKEVIGKSLAGADLPILHITNHENREKKKKNIVITGRVHPAQTNSSHLLKGFIQYILSDSKQTQELRNNTNFFIVPMLNPDGVILGNTRTSAAGKDLNRQFSSNKRQLYPQVFSIKNFTAKIHRKYGVLMYIDFHGHSRKKNTFLYGPNYPITHLDYYKSRILPKLIEKYDPRFRFYSCSFTISEEKKTTARAIMLNQFKIPYSYTIQSSLGLFYNPQTMKTLPFDKLVWEQMGSSIAVGLFNFILLYIQHQCFIRQRKQLRLKMKQQKQQNQRQSKQQKSSIKNLIRFKEDEIQIMPIKGKKGSSLLQMIEQVKVVDQMKLFDDEAQSDDHDEKEELQGYKLSQFNNMVTKGIQRQKNHIKGKKQQEIDFQTFQGAFQQQQQMEEDQLLEIKAVSQELILKKTTKAFKYSKTQDSKRKDKNIGQIIPIYKNQQVSVKKITLNQSKNKPAQPRQRSVKNFVAKNKQRYTLATKNLFPVEDKCEIVSLPRNIQAMRKSMKKGRGLLNNLQQSKLKFLSLGIRPQERREALMIRQAKNPFTQIKSSSNVFKFEGRDINYNDFRIRKSQSQFQDFDPYIMLNGFQVDNRAMTITTFKNLK